MRDNLSKFVNRMVFRFGSDNNLKDLKIPPANINYNQHDHADINSYIHEFKESACLNELPFLMSKGLNEESVLLDYGCGLGRLAYASSKFLTTNGAYFGYEPNPTALKFLKNAYSDCENFYFHGIPLVKSDDYIAIQTNEHRSHGCSSALVDLSFVKRRVNIQWSSSVFTHMWKSSIINVLSEMTNIMEPNGLCVNTWLCIDDFAAYVLRCGMADRQLPYEVDGIYTYSRENPLVCTAYKITDVREIYEAAGHKIEDILWGKWSGRGNGVTYQDIVISRPYRK